MRDRYSIAATEINFQAAPFPSLLRNMRTSMQPGTTSAESHSPHHDCRSRRETMQSVAT
jgi:hypothetical protein